MLPLALLPFMLAMTSPAKPSHSGPLLDDRAVTIHSSAEVSARRRALVRAIWGAAGLPARKMPSTVRENVASPVRGLAHLRGVARLDIAMDLGNSGLAYLFTPEKDAHRLAVLHHGHACTFDDGPGSGNPDYGMQRTLNGLLAHGFTVLAVFMPHERPDDCTGGHDQMFALSTEGSPMKFFLEPVAVCVNYALSRDRRMRDVTMIGLSGGGWTTTLYAAVDTRVRLSIPVAGSLPLYLRWGGSVGDFGETLESFYRIAGYPDLYLLGPRGGAGGRYRY